MPKGDLIDSIVRDVCSWVSGLEEFQDIPPYLLLVDWASALSLIMPMVWKQSLSWIPLPHGALKLNFDSVSKGNLGQAGYSCVIRDHDHKVIRAICGPLGECDAIKAEATSLLMGLRELNRLRLKSCEVEGDSVVVISWGRGDNLANWCLAPIIYEICELVSILSVSLSHVTRSQNELADKLANWGIVSQVVFCDSSLLEGCL